MATLRHTSFQAFIKRHPVLAYYALTFTISWASAFVVFGPGVFLGTRQISFGGQSPVAYLAFLAGPSVAGILLTGLVDGRTGLRDLRSRLFRWRVGVGFYAVALLTAPLLITVILFTLSLTSKAFLPAIITTGDKTSLLVFGIAVGLVVPFFEELGWTGFATPSLRKRHGLLATGLIMGLLWGAWHFPLFSGSASSSGLPSAFYLAVLLFSWLPPYRVLMVWVYDHTQSLLVAMLMHMTIDMGTVVLLNAPAMLGVPAVTFDLVFGATLWVVVAAVVLVGGGKHTLGENMRAIPFAHHP